MTQLQDMRHPCGERIAVRRARTRLSWDHIGLRNADDKRAKVHSLTDPAEVMDEIDAFFGSATINEGLRPDIAV